MLAEPRNATGPKMGQDSWFSVASWQMAVEMINRPAMMRFQRKFAARLFNASFDTVAAK